MDAAGRICIGATTLEGTTGRYYAGAPGAVTQGCPITV